MYVMPKNWKIWIAIKIIRIITTKFSLSQLLKFWLGMRTHSEFLLSFFLKLNSFILFRSKESPANDTKCNTTERGQNTDDVTLIKDDHGDVSTSIERRKRGYWRRMMCATVPLQAVFLSSLFLSWALDPEINGNNCGYNTGNLMNMLYPQLRYVNGPPPI